VSYEQGRSSLKLFTYKSLLYLEFEQIDGDTRIMMGNRIGLMIGDETELGFQMFELKIHRGEVLGLKRWESEKFLH